MLKYKKIKIKDKYIEALLMRLLDKNLLVLRGSKGYIMCGYLNLRVAQKFKDVAIKITGVSSLKDAVQAKVSACTRPAKRLGIYKGQPIKDVLKIIV